CCTCALPDGTSGTDWRAKWRDLAQHADRIIVPSEGARAFASMLLGRKLTLVRSRARSGSGTRPAKAPNPCCGIVPSGAGLYELELIRALARTLKESAPGAEVIVIGATMDDLGLMGIGNVFVSGAVDAAGYADAFRRHGVTKLLLPIRRAVFGDPGAAA